MKKTTLFVLISAVLGGIACSSSTQTTEPEKPKAVANIPERWAGLNNQPVNQSINESASHSLKAITWIKDFNDPLLLTLIEEAKNNNPDLTIAAANMNKAWLLTKKSKSSLQPVVDLSLAPNQSETFSDSTTSSSITVGLTTSWEADVWGRIQAGIDATQARFQSAQADYLYSLHSLCANVVKAYLAIIEAKLQANITQQNLTILTKNLRITQAKYDNGLSSAQDLALNKGNLATAQEQLISTQESQRNAMRALEVLLGRYPDATLEVAHILPSLPPSPPAGLPSSLLERRPDIVSAERQIAAAFYATKQAKAAKLPSFSLTNTISGSSNALSNILSPSNIAWQLGGSLLAPIFDGGKRKLDIEIATIEQKQALASYTKQAIVAFSEVENNLDQATSLANRATKLTEAYNQSAKAYKIAALRYKEGESELLDTLQIQQQVISAQSNLLSVQRKQLEQRVNLYLALGGSW